MMNIIYLRVKHKKYKTRNYPLIDVGVIILIVGIK